MLDLRFAWRGGLQRKGGGADEGDQRYSHPSEV
jgi:hypothetical protein